MKPREFWLDVHYEEDGFIHCIEGSDSNRSDSDIHVREVVPIDWAKVRENYYVMTGYGLNENAIQKAIEKQIENGND